MRNYFPPSRISLFHFCRGHVHSSFQKLAGKERAPTTVYFLLGRLSYMKQDRWYHCSFSGLHGRRKNVWILYQRFLRNRDGLISFEEKRCLISCNANVAAPFTLTRIYFSVHICPCSNDSPNLLLFLLLLFLKNKSIHTSIFSFYEFYDSDLIGGRFLFLSDLCSKIILLLINHSKVFY